MSGLEGTRNTRFVLTHYLLVLARIATGSSFQCPIGEATMCVAQHIEHLRHSVVKELPYAELPQSFPWLHIDWFCRCHVGGSLVMHWFDEVTSTLASMCPLTVMIIRS